MEEIVNTVQQGLMHVQVLSVHLGGQLQTEDQQNKCCILLKNTNYAGQTTEKREVNWLLFFLSSSLPLLGIFNKLKLKNQTIIIFAKFKELTVYFYIVIIHQV